jgi:hypothetical protein
MRTVGGMVTGMAWSLCDGCSTYILFRQLKNCDFCGLMFCPACDPQLDRAVCCMEHGCHLNFCSGYCNTQYACGYRRSHIRKRKRPYDSDSD